MLLSQNRLQAAADRRAELDLHINLLAERESTLILTKLARLEARLGIEAPAAETAATVELTRRIDAAAVLDELEHRP